MSVSLYGSGQTVLQVVQSSGNTQFSTTSSSYVSTGFTATITPQSTNSKILVFVNGVYADTSGASTGAIAIGRGSAITASETIFVRTAGSSTYTQTIAYLDSPSTTSSTTYTLYLKAISGTVFVSETGLGAGTNVTITLMEISGS